MEAPCYKSQECSEMPGTALQVSAMGTVKAMMASETIAAATILTTNTISMMDNTLQRITQQPFAFTKVYPEHPTNDYQDNMLVSTSPHMYSGVFPSTNTTVTNHSIYSYFSSNFQVAANHISVHSRHFS